MSVEEFLATKQQKPIEQPKQVVKPEDTQKLQIKAKQNAEMIGLSTATHTKKGKKQKEQKINKAEEELNQQVFGNMKIEDSSKRDYYHKERYNKGKNQKFKYNPDEFPEL